MNKTDLINSLIEAHGFQSYLEIGLGDGENFANVKCDYKFGVDPNVNFNIEVFWVTSDEFFNNNPNKFDLIFIDGLHEAHQVEKDIVNAWNCLNKGGIILIHDIKPENEEMTLIPRETKQWTGNVYHAWYGFLNKYPKIKTQYIDIPFGMGLIHKSKHKLELGFVDTQITFGQYQTIEGWKPKN